MALIMERDMDDLVAVAPAYSRHRTAGKKRQCILEKHKPVSAFR
jgi:hypothetical protein